jgi:hypothetical protein
VFRPNDVKINALSYMRSVPSYKRVALLDRLSTPTRMPGPEPRESKWTIDKGPSAWTCNWVTLILRDVNTENWPYNLREPSMLDTIKGNEFVVTRTRERPH